MEDKDYLESVKRGTKRVGKTVLLKYLQGGRLTARQAIRAKCYDCNGLGEQKECDIKTCPLYPYTQREKIATA